MPGTSLQRSSRGSARARAIALEEGTAKAVRTSAPLEVLAAQAKKILSLGFFPKIKIVARSSPKILGTRFLGFYLRNIV